MTRTNLSGAGDANTPVDDPFDPESDDRRFLPAHFVAQMIVQLSVKDGLLHHQFGWYIVFITSGLHAAIPFMWRIFFAKWVHESGCQASWREMVLFHFNSLTGWIHVFSALVNWCLTYSIAMRFNSRRHSNGAMAKYPTPLCLHPADACANPCGLHPVTCNGLSRH